MTYIGTAEKVTSATLGSYPKGVSVKTADFYMHLIIYRTLNQVTGQVTWHAWPAPTHWDSQLGSDNGALELAIGRRGPDDPAVSGSTVEGVLAHIHSQKIVVFTYCFEVAFTPIQPTHPLA